MTLFYAFAEKHKYLTLFSDRQKMKIRSSESLHLFHFLKLENSHHQTALYGYYLCFW